MWGQTREFCEEFTEEKAEADRGNSSPLRGRGFDLLPYLPRCAPTGELVVAIVARRLGLEGVQRASFPWPHAKQLIKLAARVDTLAAHAAVETDLVRLGAVAPDAVEVSRPQLLIAEEQDNGFGRDA